MNEVARKAREKRQAERAQRARSLAPGETLLRRSEVTARVGLARSTIYARIQAGTFPAPVRTGTNSVAWVASEIERWIEGRVAARDGTDV